MVGEIPSVKEGRSAETPKPLRAALDNAKRVILFDSVEVLRVCLALPKDLNLMNRIFSNRLPSEVYIFRYFFNLYRRFGAKPFATFHTSLCLGL